MTPKKKVEPNPVTNPHKADAPQVEETEEQKRGRLLKQAYSSATSRLREAHKEEFDGFYQEEAEARGVEYTPRPTAEQKAEAELASLLEKFPHLRSKVDEVAETESA